jgi:hypothetical protein
MKFSKGFEKDELYDQLFKSFDEKFEKKSIIPEKYRFCLCTDTDEDAVQKRLEEHQAFCREKFGTDEGIVLWILDFGSIEKPDY